MLLALCLAGFVLAALPIVITILQEVVARLRYRHIPGPRTKWITGNLPEILKSGVLACLNQWIAKYGRLTRFRMMGRQYVVVADLDAARTVMAKFVNHADYLKPIMYFTPWDLCSFERFGLLLAKDDYWRWLRTAWQPAFAPPSLRAYQGLIDRFARRLVSQLEARVEAEESKVDKGHDKAEQTSLEMDIYPEMSQLAFGVIGAAGYGADFYAPEYGTTDGPSVMSAAIDWFRSLSTRTNWFLATAFPCIMPLARCLAGMLPDKPLARHIKDRRVLKRAALGLVKKWEAKQGGLKAKGPPDGATITNGSDGGEAAPGNFLGLLLSDRSKKSKGRILTNLEIEGQVQTFMLNGFETTGSALTYAIMLLSLNPDKAALLRAEIDMHMPQYKPYDGGDPTSGPPELTLDVLDKLVYTEAVLNEAMRLHPPAWSTTRIVDKPIKILGYDIPVGTSVLIPIFHLHRQESTWPEPEAFRPERFLPTEAEGGGGASNAASSNLIAFGGGTRRCPGFRFSIQEMKTALAYLYHRFELELVPGQLPIKVTEGLTMTPKHGLRVRVSRRRV